MHVFKVILNLLSVGYCQWVGKLFLLSLTIGTIKLPSSKMENTGERAGLGSSDQAGWAVEDEPEYIIF